ncbi:AraC family transcriptional regulator [Bradyrhizobium sp. TM239]|uniref:AraC family transcriptional regulator n=1 Tax=Bradyrhizobium sp. TM239 TaxID=2599802 RepID=UPI0030C6A3D3
MRSIFSSADADEMVSMTSRLLSPHKLLVRDRGAFGGRLVQSQFASLSLSHLVYGTELEVRAESMGDDVFLLAVLLSGESVTRQGGQHVVTNCDVGCILTPNTSFSTEWSPDCSKILIKVDRRRAERELSRLIGQDLRRPLRFEMEVAFGSDHIRTLRTLVDVMRAEASASVIGPERLPIHRSLEAAFVSTLLLSQPHNYSDILNHRRSAAVPWYIRRAEEFIKRHSSRPVSLTEITNAAGVSARSLQVGFQKFRGVSPMEFLRDYRLDQVRNEIEAAGGKGLVREFACAAGFTNMSKFARSYRARFGQTPRETLRFSGESPYSR